MHKFLSSAPLPPPQFWIHILALPLTHVILGKSLDLSEPLFPHL